METLSWQISLEHSATVNWERPGFVPGFRACFGRILSPKDVARTAVYLVSDESEVSLESFI